MTYLKDEMTEEKVDGLLISLATFEILIKTVLAHEEYNLDRPLIETVQEKLIGILALHTVFLAGANPEHQDQAIDATIKHFLAMRTQMWNSIQAFNAATNQQESNRNVH